MLSQSKLFFVLIFLSGLILFTFGLSQQEFIAFETRFALFAKEMLQHGFTAFPTTYGQFYPDYPVTSTYLIYLLALSFGSFTKLIAVFPSAIAAAVTLTTTYAIGALRNKYWGIYASLLLLMTGNFLFEARSISLDQYTTAVTCLSFYCVYSAEVLQKPARIYWLPLLFILGFMFRGPIGLVIPAGVISGFYLLDKNYKNLFFIIFISAILLIICGTALLYLAYHAGGVEFSKQVLSLEITSRMHSSNNGPAFYYYFLNSFGAYLLTLPMAILVLLGLNKDLPDLKLLKKLAIWVLIIIIGMSIPADKKMRYILAISPALALISAYLFIIPNKNKYFNYLSQIFFQFFVYLPLLSLILALGIFIFIKYKMGLLIINYWSLSILSLLAVINFYNKKYLTVLICSVLAFAVLTIFYVEPVNLYLNRTKDFVIKIEHLRQQEKADLVFYQEGRDGLPIKYMVNSPSQDTPIFIDTPENLTTLKNKAVFLAGETEFSQIPTLEQKKFQIIAKDLIGRKKMIVFTQQDFSSTTDPTALLEHPAK